jgi:hypothetical protein
MGRLTITTAPQITAKTITAGAINLLPIPAALPGSLTETSIG